MISILTPSRSRPMYVQRMIKSALETAGASIEIKLYLNDDDPLLKQYTDNIDADRYIIGPNQSTSFSWNLMAENTAYDILFLVGDDAQFCTPNWASVVKTAFDRYPDKIACVYPKVPTLSKNKNPHFCLHRNWINALGFFLPPHFHHWYVDTWIKEVAMSLDRFHCLYDFELPIENIKDETNLNYHRSWMRLKDDWMWNHTKRYREKDIETLREYISNFKD